MTAFLREAILIVVIACSACVLVRWVVPAVLRAVSGPLADGVAVLAACLLLPEYLVSSHARRRGSAPPHLAYEYGSAVAGATDRLQRVVRGLCRVLAAGAPNAPLPLVAVAAVALRILFVLLT